MNTIYRRLMAVSTSLVLLFALASVASAHEHREVGEYEFTVGFINEPALVNEPNGLDLRIQEGHGDDGTPVEGLQDTLEAEITYGGETMPLELRARFGQPGAYTADVFPTATGTYTFRIFGTINGTEIDESFTGGPDTFSEVMPISEIAFPAGEGATGDGTDEGGEGASAIEAQDTADTAQTLAIVGIVAGVLGLIAGAVGVMMAMNARSARATTTPVTREAGD